MLEQDRRKPGLVYFLQSDVHDLVKIGVTNNIKTRMSTIISSCPCNLVLAGTIEKKTWNEAQALEQRLHRRFKEQKVKGEWFRLDSNTIAETIEEENKTPSPFDRSLSRLSVEDKIEQEAKWQDDGTQAYYDGIPLKDFPHIGKRYSNVWYRARSAWRSGWQEARHANNPIFKTRTIVSRF